MERLPKVATANGHVSSSSNSVELPFQLFPAEMLVAEAQFSAQTSLLSTAHLPVAQHFRYSSDGISYNHKSSLYLTNYRLFVLFAHRRSEKSNKNENRMANVNGFAKNSFAFYNIVLRSIDSVDLREMTFLYVFCKMGHLAKIAFDNNETCAHWFKLIYEAASPKLSLRDIFAFGFFEQCRNSPDDQINRKLFSDDLNDYALHSGIEMNSLSPDGGDLDNFDLVRREFDRLRYNSKFWRITDLNCRQNATYCLCSTYPKFWIVPASLTDDQLESAARYRSRRRTAAVVWRHPMNGAVLVRCSQPESGLFGWRSASDEYLLQSIRESAYCDSPRHRTTFPACNGNGMQSDNSDTGEDSANESTINDPASLPMLILDARSYTAAWANRAKGGGFENKENYQNCEIEFLGLANIHAVRSSFQKLRSLLWDSNGVIAGRSTNAPNAQSSFNNDLYYESGYFQNLDACQWPQHLFILLNASAKVVHALHKQGRCVLVHCSDGWDRTTQIVSLAKLMLDPYYRTMQGFKELLEREWIAFGHKFAERCGLLANGDPNQKAPVFLQWLDCVRYLLREFPCSFQFNEIYLLKLAQHCYSGLFGTFLCDTIREYDIESVGHRTFSIWSYLNNAQNTSFRNFLYDDNFLEKKNFACNILIVRPQIRDLTSIWRALYCPYDDPANQHRVTSCNGSEWAAAAAAAPLDDAALTQSINHGGLPKTHSFDDLLLASMKDVKISDDVPRVHGPQDRQNYTTDKDAVTSPFSSLHRSTSEFTLQQQQSEISDSKENKKVDNELNNGTLDQNLSLNRLSSSENLDESRLNVKDRKPFYDIRQKEAESQDFYSNDRNSELTKIAGDMPNVVLDVDGMRICTDPVQQRIEEIVDSYERRIAAGRMEIERLRIMIARSQENQAQGGNGIPENDKLNDSFEPGSLDSRTSEASWEAIMEDRNDVQRPVLWTPDHATTRCANCRAQFWAIKRRHHCRNCGKVFCSICTNYECPVPQEQLFRPVRVCIKCFERLSVEQEEY